MIYIYMLVVCGPVFWLGWHFGWNRGFNSCSDIYRSYVGRFSPSIYDLTLRDTDEQSGRRRCQLCGGSGFMVVSRESRLCGPGLIAKTCSACRGTGVSSLSNTP